MNDTLRDVETAIQQQTEVLKRILAELQTLTARTPSLTGLPQAPCVCGNFTPGELTGGWYCPVHHQQR